MIIKEIRIVNKPNLPNNGISYVVQLQHEKTIQDIYKSILEFEKEFNRENEYWEVKIHEKLEEGTNSWKLASKNSNGELEEYNGPMRIKIDNVEIANPENGYYSFDIYLKI